MAEKKSSIGEIESVLKKDATSPYPKFPSQSFHAVRDKDVARSLTRRFEQGARIRNIRALEYDFNTGLNRLCFEFDGAGPMAGGDDILILLDANCRVVGIVDPFDSKQPNRMVPPLTALGGAIPFVLQRPSASDNLPFDQSDLAPQDSRAHEFMARMIGGGGFGGHGGLGETDPCGPEAQTTMCTYCSFSMQTLKWLSPTRFDRSVYGMDCSQMDTNSDDCGTMA